MYLYKNVLQQVLSKRHAKIFYKGNKVFLKDLGSTNGTYINKVRLSRPGLMFLSSDFYARHSFFQGNPAS